jgi:hypothetical protein
MAVHAGVAGAKVTIGHVSRNGFYRLLVHRVARPRPLVAMGGDDNPFLAQRMPALFPVLGGRSLAISGGSHCNRYVELSHIVSSSVGTRSARTAKPQYALA